MRDNIHLHDTLAVHSDDIARKLIHFKRRVRCSVFHSHNQSDKLLDSENLDLTQNVDAGSKYADISILSRSKPARNEKQIYVPAAIK